MFPYTYERIGFSNCICGQILQGKSDRSFPTHPTTVEKGLLITQYFRAVKAIDIYLSTALLPVIIL